MSHRERTRKTSDASDDCPSDDSTAPFVHVAFITVIAAGVRVTTTRTPAQHHPLTPTCYDTAL